MKKQDYKELEYKIFHECNKFNKTKNGYILSISGISDELGVHKNKVRSWAKSNKIKIKDKYFILIPIKKAEEFFKSINKSKEFLRGTVIKFSSDFISNGEVIEKGDIGIILKNFNLNHYLILMGNDRKIIVPNKKIKTNMDMIKLGGKNG